MAMKLTFINVGYGEALLLECPDPSCQNGTFVMVIDGGSNEKEEYAHASSGRIRMADYLTKIGLDHIDVMVITHIHEDHICGLVPVLEKWKPQYIWQTLPVDYYEDMKHIDAPIFIKQSEKFFIKALNDYIDICSTAKESGIMVSRLGAGEELDACPGLDIKILQPTADQEGDLEGGLNAIYSADTDAMLFDALDDLDGRMNNMSLMMVLEYEGVRILLAGDTNAEGYNKLTSEDVHADLFMMGHHGQKDGVSPELLKMISPKAAVCCASSDRRYDSAEPGMLHMIANEGVKVYFSDCPKVPGLSEDVPAHSALEFTIGSGDISARYI